MWDRFANLRLTLRLVTSYKKQGAQLSVSDQVQTIRILGHTAYRDSQQFVRWLLRCKPKDVYPSHNRLCTKRQLLLLDSLRKAF